MSDPTLRDVMDAEFTELVNVEVFSTKLDGKWLLVDGSWGTRHVVPVNDLVEHRVYPDDECICGPEIGTMDDEGFFSFVAMHSSLDGRETR